MKTPEVGDHVIMENDDYLSYMQYRAPHEKELFKDFLETNIGKIHYISVEHQKVSVRYDISHKSTFIDHLFYLYLDIKTQKYYYEFSFNLLKIKEIKKAS